MRILWIKVVGTVGIPKKVWLDVVNEKLKKNKFEVWRMEEGVIVDVWMLS